MTRWRGQKWVRGRIYQAATPADFLEMMSSGLFVPAEAAPPQTTRDALDAQARRIEFVAVRNAGLGDVLIALPYVQEFSRANPRIDVSYAVPPALYPLIRLQPDLARVYDLGEGRDFPREIDLCHYAERHRSDRIVPRELLFAEAFGIKRRLPPASLALDASWVAQARALVEGYGHTLAQPIATLTACGTTTRRSYAAALLLEVARHLEEAGVFVMLTDLERTPDGRPGFHGSVPELAGLLSIADVVVGPDTGVLHLGGALGKPLVGIFTDWPARLRLSPYNAIAFEPRKLPCAPCFDRGCAAQPCTISADPKEVAAAAISCLAPRWRLHAPADSISYRAKVGVFGRPRTA